LLCGFVKVYEDFKECQVPGVINLITATNADIQASVPFAATRIIGGIRIFRPQMVDTFNISGVLALSLAWVYGYCFAGYHFLAVIRSGVKLLSLIMTAYDGHTLISFPYIPKKTSFASFS